MSKQELAQGIPVKRGQKGASITGETVPVQFPRTKSLAERSRKSWEGHNRRGQKPSLAHETQLETNNPRGTRGEATSYFFEREVHQLASGHTLRNRGARGNMGAAQEKLELGSG